jgi:hypothetical protein
VSGLNHNTIPVGKGSSGNSSYAGVSVYRLAHGDMWMTEAEESNDSSASHCLDSWLAVCRIWHFPDHDR